MIMNKEEQHSPKWLLKKIEESDSDTVKLLYIIEFQNNIGMNKKEQIELITEAWNKSKNFTLCTSEKELQAFLKSKGLVEKLENNIPYKYIGNDLMEGDTAPIVFKTGESSGYGIGADGKWEYIDKDDSIICTWSFKFGNYWQPATDEEWKAALIGEAEKRGFKKGARYKSAVIRGTFTFSGKLQFYNWTGNDINKQFCLYDSRFEGCIFDATTGKWATLIEEPTTEEKIEILWKERNK